MLKIGRYFCSADKTSTGSCLIVFNRVTKCHLKEHMFRSIDILKYNICLQERTSRQLRVLGIFPSNNYWHHADVQYSVSSESCSEESTAVKSSEGLVAGRITTVQLFLHIHLT